MARVPLREAAYEAIKARLVEALDGVAVERNRRSLVTGGEGDLLVLRDGGQNPNPGAVGEDHFVMDAVLEGYVEADDEEVGAELSALYGRAAEALAGPEALPIPLGDGLTEIILREGTLEIDIATVTQSETAVAAFYLDLSFDLRVPFGTRFLVIP
jgi:hypothetical protein